MVMFGSCSGVVTRPMVLVLVVGAVVTAATTPPPPPPLPPPTQQVKMVTPAPRPEALIILKDCPVYVLGELRGIKKHGDTWLNDGSACELCKCVDGQKRCYYHYCNAGLTEGFMTPPSGRPPLDDEDREEGDEEEGSGHPPYPEDYYKVINHISSPVQGPWGGVGGDGGEMKKPISVGVGDSVGSSGVNNEAQEVPPMCSSFCDKFCPWGFKLDKRRGCLRCKCYKCLNPSLAQCNMRCLGHARLTRDSRGCQVCSCRSKGLLLLKKALHPSSSLSADTPTTTTVTNTQTHMPCNDSRGSGAVENPGVNEDDMGGLTWADPAQRDTVLFSDPSSRDRHQHHHQHSPGDGTTKSAVQASPVEWWQVWVIVTPLVLVVVLVCGAAVRYWRRYHHDKYHINAYRPTETEKLRPVATADDHHHHHLSAHNNQRVRHL